MNGNQQSALAALKSVEPLIARLDGSQSAEDRAADILELWQGPEKALRALMGTAEWSGTNSRVATARAHIARSGIRPSRVSRCTR